MISIWCFTCAFETEVNNLGPVALANAEKRHLKHDGAHDPRWIESDTDEPVKS